MKFFIQVIATVIVCLVLQLFLPWWSMALGAFGVAYFTGNKSFISFLAGFISIALLWSVFAFYLDFKTDSILTAKVNQLLPVNAFLLTALVGALVGGFAALTGALFKRK
ncbi:MAG: hypothetical protein J0L67_02120 [Cytophagales bacterium]|nr:hypothetical protein [Cytophagales bacterium]